MATDVAVVGLVLSNNLTDPSEPIYLIGVLAMLEATMRWHRRGGVVGGLVAGLAAGAWTMVVSDRAVGGLDVDHATMRAGTIIALGVFLGSLVRRMSEQQDMLQGILDTTQDLIVVIDAEGTILSINAACRPMLGYAPAEMIGRKYRGFFHPDDVRTGPHTLLTPSTGRAVLHERRVITQRSAGGEAQEYEIRLTGRDGDVLDLDVTNTPIVVDGEVVACSAWPRT